MKEKLIFGPCIVVLTGVPLSGKTHLARALEEQSNLIALDVDAIRNEIDESRRANSDVRMLEPEQEKAIMVRSYAELCRRAEQAAISGSSMLITGTFSRAEFKPELERIVKSGKVVIKIFLLTVSDEEAILRIEKRKTEGSLSNIDSLEKYQWAKSIFGKIDFAPVTEITSDINSVFQNLADLAQ